MTGPTVAWADFASRIRYEDLPGEIVAAAKGLLLDTIGTALAASTLGDCCPQVAAILRDDPGRPDCAFWGFGGRVSATQAAFGNGALSHALNFDALGPEGGHLGLAAVPAPFAAAERKGGVPGRELVAAVALAAEFTARLAAALSRAGVDANERFLEGQILGYFGAAAGAARILRFSPERMHSVLGLALAQCAGTRQVSYEGAPAKAIYGGYANHGAMLSVRLAGQGIDARCAALEGRAGLYAMCYGGIYDAAALTDGLGEDFLAPVFKRWPVSMMVHPFIEASLALRVRHRIAPGSIHSIHARASSHTVAWLDPARRHPANAATAANSIYFGIAKALANGDVTLTDITAEGLRQQAAHDLAGRIGFAQDEALGQGGAVEITLASGEILTKVVTGVQPPAEYDLLAAKFRDCAGHAAHPLSPDAVERIIERVARLEALEDVGSIAGLLGGER